MFGRLLRKITETVWLYKLSHSEVRIAKGAKCTISKSVKIKNSFIFVDSHSTLVIEDGVDISNFRITITNGGVLRIGKYSVLRKGRNCRRPELMVDDGYVTLSGHDILQCDRIWVRFGGNLNVGEYVNINSESEIRCDESVNIGDFTQISYNVRIWDTNTHKILSPEERRDRTIKYYPYCGFEIGKPQTNPVSIGSGGWIGERAAILKGCKIGKNVSVGYGTHIIGKEIPDGVTVVQNIDIRIFESVVTSDL